jgi:hypothetical protein
MNVSRLAQALGRLGGLARARRLPAAERRRIAALGGLARRRSLRAARRIAENFQYLAAIRELRPDPPVKRLRGFRGRLPGLYPPAT